MKLLSGIASPADLKLLDFDDLQTLCSELRAFILGSVSETGGHLASNLGVIELTVALHHMFETPKDHLVWDVGHQCYAHKILTGRREAMKTLRKVFIDRKSTRLNSSHSDRSRMPSSA